MSQQQIELKDHQATGYIVNLGPVNLVYIVTQNGMLGCGAFDVMALDKFDYPAARIRSVDGAPIATVDDLLQGIVAQSNVAAVRREIHEKMPARRALELLQ